MEEFLGRRHPSGVQEAEYAQDEEEAGGDEGDYGGDPRDHAHGSEGVGIEQQTPGASHP